MRNWGSAGARVIVTCMKNEGPFVLEWLAHHRATGFGGFLVYSNDCTDGTDHLLDVLQAKGQIQHRRNPFRESGLRPQHAAFRAAEDEEIVKRAEWLACIDVDEFVNVKCGNGTLDDLFAHIPDAALISMTWRLFGNGDQRRFTARPVIEQFLRCAPEFIRRPHQAWGFKTLYRKAGFANQLGVHRPKDFDPEASQKLLWVNGSGRPMPRTVFQRGWRSTPATYGYNLVQLNHYVVRSAESFLVKRDRGRVNHVGRDQGLPYWFRMNNNAVEDRSILRRLDAMRRELDALIRDPEIRSAHETCIENHRAKIASLKADLEIARFYDALTSARFENLSRLHAHFGTNVFLAGPSVIPDHIAASAPQGAWFFTVPRPDVTQH